MRTTTAPTVRSTTGSTLEDLEAQFLMADGAEAQLEAIAVEALGVDTLATRRSDLLDFHDLAIWNVEAAMQAAYAAGVAAGKGA